jgi:hypothetical protein
MERMAWRHERLDELARHPDTRFDAVDRRFEQVDRRDRRRDLDGLSLIGDLT